jgi:hypothetical protein
MEASSSHNHAGRIVPMKGRNPQSWHGTAPPALDGAAGEPPVRNLFKPIMETERVCDVYYVDVLIFLSGKVAIRY